MMQSGLILQIGFSFLALVVILLLISFSRRMIVHFARKHNFHEKRLFLSNITASMIIFLVTGFALVIKSGSSTVTIQLQAG